MPLFVISSGLTFIIEEPRYSIAPLVGVYIPVMQLNAVVFPAPFGPIIATISFLLTSRYKESIALSPPN